jgi:hypothetical protein
MYFFLTSVELYAYDKVYVITDKDGYTNVREKPDARSKILGQVHKYQIFFSLVGYCENELPETEKWEPITRDTLEGYIYKRNIISVLDMPSITGKGKYTLSSNDKESIILGENDSIKLILHLEPFDYKPYNPKEYFAYGGSSDALEENLAHKTMNNQIKEMKIVYNNETIIILPQEIIKKYCDVRHVSANIGFSGELYLNITGGEQGALYSVWFSIVDGKIMYETMNVFCW